MLSTHSKAETAGATSHWDAVLKVPAMLPTMSQAPCSLSAPTPEKNSS